MRIKKNDQVVVLSGNYKGKKGKVLKVFPEANRIIVEGVNFIKRHTRPSQQNPQGGIVEKEAPIHVSNVMVVCPKTGVASRVGHKSVHDDKLKKDVRVRIAKKSGEMLP
ncbi:MAG TPA: 50S ribosomal protein L24 [bacterium]|jgi:large subunit ribosomal protein L24|nr:50S ribosomal protein L24 [bacterium]HNT65347.1 50S ribosomal protein L24 [bacterium]HOX86515.1 50S ribosomal protein L24 [bacterium]HPG46541.1 50S ribosomal protein L24 [bacterium]HPM98403.1 50S ribosomal protein L24 [bacterium]